MVLLKMPIYSLPAQLFTDRCGSQSSSSNHVFPHLPPSFLPSSFLLRRLLLLLACCTCCTRSQMASSGCYRGARTAHCQLWMLWGTPGPEHHIAISLGICESATCRLKFKVEKKAVDVIAILLFVVVWLHTCNLNSGLNRHSGAHSK